MRNRLSKIEDICQGTDIAEIYFIMDRSELRRAGSGIANSGLLHQDLEWGQTHCLLLWQFRSLYLSHSCSCAVWTCHYSYGSKISNPKINKKVLLRERKRHTARCVANTRYVVLTGYLPPRGGTRSGTPRGVRVPPLGGYPVRSGNPPGGYPVRYPPRGVQVPPLGGYLVRSGQVPSPGGVRVPPGGVPSQVPPGGSGYPPTGGYPVRSGQVPPRGGTQSGTPGGGPGTPPGGGKVPSQVPPLGGYPDPPPPPVDRQTPVKTVPSRRTTYAGGKNNLVSQ